MPETATARPLTTNHCSLENLLEEMIMKNIAIVTAIALSSSIAIAEPHAYQQQVGSSELDPSISEGPGSITKREGSSDFTPSLIVFYENVDVDGSAEFAFVGNIEESGPSRISLYEMQRGSPEGTANRDYYERFPAGTDWSAVAENRKVDPGNV